MIKSTLAKISVLAFAIFCIGMIVRISVMPNEHIINHPDSAYLSAEVLAEFEAQKSLLLDYPITSFDQYGIMNDDLLKYQLAFLGYSAASIAITDPSRRTETILILDMAIQKMKQRPVWKDWIEDGKGDNAFTTDNVMFRGNLSLLMGLHQAFSGNDKYEAENLVLIKSMHHELLTSGFFGLRCSPDNYYIGCAAVAVLSMKIYDVLHHTGYGLIAQQWIGWIQENMVDQGTGNLAKVYHPSLPATPVKFTSQHAAWALIFLPAVAPEFAAKHYPIFVDTYMENLPNMMSIRKYRGIPLIPDPLSAGFAMVAAHEMNDTETLNGLYRTAKIWGFPYNDAAGEHWIVGNSLSETVLLFSQVSRLKDFVPAVKEMAN